MLRVKYAIVDTLHYGEVYNAIVYKKKKKKTTKRKKKPDKSYESRRTFY